MLQPISRSNSPCACGSSPARAKLSTSQKLQIANVASGPGNPSHPEIAVHEAVRRELGDRGVERRARPGDRRARRSARVPRASSMRRPESRRMPARTRRCRDRRRECRSSIGSCGEGRTMRRCRREGCAPVPSRIARSTATHAMIFDETKCRGPPRTSQMPSSGRIHCSATTSTAPRAGPRRTRRCRRRPGDTATRCRASSRTRRAGTVRPRRCRRAPVGDRGIRRACRCRAPAGTARRRRRT